MDGGGAGGDPTTKGSLPTPFYVLNKANVETNLILFEPIQISSQDFTHNAVGIAPARVNTFGLLVRTCLTGVIRTPETTPSMEAS